MKKLALFGLCFHANLKNVLLTEPKKWIYKNNVGIKIVIFSVFDIYRIIHKYLQGDQKQVWILHIDNTLTKKNNEYKLRLVIW